MTRREAKMVAEELMQLLHPTIETIAKEVSERTYDKWMSTEEAALYLGISVNTLYKKQDIPKTKVGGTLRYSKLALDNYMIRK